MHANYILEAFGDIIIHNFQFAEINLVQIT